MGNSSCGASLSHQDITSQHGLGLVQKMNHPSLGEVSIFKQSPSGNHYMYLTRSFPDDASFNQFREQCEQQQFICQRSIINLFKFIPIKQTQLCSQSYQMVLIYNYYFNNLQTEYMRRQHQGLLFTEQEVTYIIRQVVKGLQVMHGAHGELDLDNIMLDDNDEIVILDHSFLRNSPSQKHARYNRSRYFKEKYLSGKQPIFLDEWQFQSYDPDSTYQDHSQETTVHHGDVFSLGLICLQLMRLEEVSQIYNFDNFSIDFGRLEQFQDQLKKTGNYSQGLMDLLQNMLHRREYMKYTNEQVLQHIEKNEMGQASKVSFNESQVQSLLLKNNGLTQSVSQLDNGTPKHLHQTLMLSQIKEHRENEQEVDDCNFFMHDQDISQINKVNQSMTRQEKSIRRDKQEVSHVIGCPLVASPPSQNKRPANDTADKSVCQKLNYIDPKIQMVIEQLKKDEMQQLKEFPVKHQLLNSMKVEEKKPKNLQSKMMSSQAYDKMWRPTTQENRVHPMEQSQRNEQLTDLEKKRKHLMEKYKRKQDNA